jgi:UDP-N-acetylmuramoylalanine--D-glutamate ligase
MSFPSVRADGLTLILGLGETGVAAALWCARHGARLRVVDTRAEPGGLSGLQAELDASSVDFRLGSEALSEDALQDVHTIVLSPGLSPLHEPVKSFLALAQARQIQVVGEIELFARALADMSGQGYSPKVLAVTGTNGKTTVTAMARPAVCRPRRRGTSARPRWQRCARRWTRTNCPTCGCWNCRAFSSKARVRSSLMQLWC